MIKALESSLLVLASFIGSFLFLLVASKIVIAILVEKSRDFLKRDAYIYTLNFLGILLIIFAIIFLKNALTYFKII